MGSCLSVAAPGPVVTMAPALSANDPDEARQMALLEQSVARAERRNTRLRLKVEAQAGAEAAAADAQPEGHRGSSDRLSLRVEVGSRASSNPQPSPRHPTRASSRHFPPNGPGRR